MYGCVPASAGTHEGQEGASDLLELEQWALVSHLTTYKVPRTKLRFSERAVHSLNPCTISPWLRPQLQSVPQTASLPLHSPLHPNSSPVSQGSRPDSFAYVL